MKSGDNTVWWILGGLAVGGAIYFATRPAKAVKKVRQVPPKPTELIPVSPLEPPEDPNSLGTWTFGQIAALPDPVIFVIRKDQTFKIECSIWSRYFSQEPKALEWGMDGIVLVHPDVDWGSTSAVKVRIDCGALSKTIWVMGA